MGRGALALLAVALACPPGPAQGQQRLEETAESFTRLWEAGDLEGVEALLADGPINLFLEDRAYTSIPRRNAGATLGQYLEAKGKGTATVVRTERTAFDTGLGFAQIDWDIPLPGTPDVLRYTVFVELTGTSGGWRVTEIRILPPGRD